MKIAGAIGAPV